MGGSGLAAASESLHRPHPGVWMGGSRYRGRWLEPRETLGFGSLWPALVVQTSLSFQGPDYSWTFSTNYPAALVARPQGKLEPKRRGKSLFPILLILFYLHKVLPAFTWGCKVGLRKNGVRMSVLYDSSNKVLFFWRLWPHNACLRNVCRLLKSF